MRVSSNTFPDSLVTQLGRLSAHQVRLQTEAATGQRMAVASDDPVAMRRTLDLQAQAHSVAQYQRNIARQEELADAVFASLKNLQKVSDRAGEIATLADGLKSPEQLRAYAAEIDQLLHQAVQIANTTNRGDYLFAGTRTDQPPFIAATNADGQVASVAWQGNATVPAAEIAPAQALAIQPPGANSSGAGPRGLFADSRSGADFFAHLVALRDHLAAADVGAVETDRAQLARDEDNLLYHYGLNGALQSRLEAAAAGMSGQSLALESSVSREVDADLAQTLVRLNETQNAYQAALQTGASMLRLSLLDYLR
ncbi:MAG: hypothetical protein AB1705_04635 [Verrucomicrobiota bacterium]